MLVLTIKRYEHETTAESWPRKDRAAYGSYEFLEDKHHLDAVGDS